jgi:pimeloyl-ACP methyl ester carboxylesterase
MMTQSIVEGSAAAVSPAGATDASNNVEITRTAPNAGHIASNGVNYHYQIHGRAHRDSTPLLLLHGSLEQIETFGPVLSGLAAQRQVIGVDLQGHGRSSMGTGEFNLTDMGDDIAVILKTLGYGKVDVLGYSLGGLVAFRCAVQHPETVRRLVLVAAGYARDGFYPEILRRQMALNSLMAGQIKTTPWYQSYSAVAPRPEDFPALLDRLGTLMRRPYDWSAEVGKLNMPVMLVYGDGDFYRPEHIIKFYQLLGGGLKYPGGNREFMGKNRLAILPNLTHTEIGMSPALTATIEPFLDAPEGQ